MPKHLNLWEAVTAPFQIKSGQSRKSDIIGHDLSKANGWIDRWADSAGGDVDVLGLDTNNRLMLGGASHRPLRMALQFNLAANASQATQRFFTADQNYEIVGILYQHNTANGAALTATITKEVSGQAPGAGSAVHTGTANCNGTANVVQSLAIATRTQPELFGAGEASASLATGEMLSIKFSTSITSLAGVTITVFVIPKNSIAPAVINLNANAAIATQCFFLANRPVTVTGISMVWSTAGSDAGAVTVDVTKDTSTNAPGAGVSLLNAAQSVKGTANVPVSPALTGTTSRLTLAAGDRLAIKTTGTLTALAGLVVVVSFSNAAPVLGVPNPVAGMAQPCFKLAANASLGTDQDFFIADRDYEVYDVSAVWSTAGGAAYRVTVTVDGSTVADGAGTSVLTDNSNAGFDATATANTVVVGTLAVSKRTIFLPAGSRLGVHFGGTKGSFAGLVVACSLVPR